MSKASDLREYLQSCCEQHGFSGIAVADEHGMMLAQEGDDMHDAFIAYLPGWLAAGEQVSKLGGLGGAACSCVVPKNRSALMLAWSAIRSNEEKIFFAILTKSLPARLVATLDEIAITTCNYIDHATSVNE